MHIPDGFLSISMFVMVATKLFVGSI